MVILRAWRSEVRPRVVAGAAALTLLAALVTSAPAQPGPGVRARPEIVTVVHDPPGVVPVLGPRLAPVTIEFFCNLGDGTASAQVYRLLTQLHQRHPRRLRVLFRLVSSGERSNPHIEAGLEAFSQGRFIAFASALYADSGRSPRVSQLADIARGAGVDPRRLAEALSDGRHAAQATANHFYRKRHRVRRVPGLLINGEPYDRRPRTIDELEELYDAAYARSRAPLARGVPLSDLYPRLLEQVVARRPAPLIGPGAVDGLRPGERPPLGPAPLVDPRALRGGHHRGPDDALVTIHLFCNFQTRNCAQTAAMLDEVMAAYPDEVRLAFHHLYDPGDRREDRALDLGRAALCADRAGRFWDFYDLVYRQARQGSVRVALADLPDLLDTDGGRFAACLSDHRVAGRLRAERRRDHALGVSLTPSVVLGGRLYTGTKSFDELAGLVDRELLPGVLGRIAPK